MRSGNAQLYLRAGLQFAPYCQPASYPLGPFAHSAQSKVPRSSVANQKLRFNTFPVVTHAQPKAPFVVPDFYLDMLRIGMAERVTQRLRSHAIHFVAEDRV